MTFTKEMQQKMLKALNSGNFCSGVDCGDCPLNNNDDCCERQEIYRKIENALAKKVCPKCGAELKE